VTTEWFSGARLTFYEHCKPIELAGMTIGLTLTEYEHKHHYYVNWLKGDDAIEVIVFSVKDNNAKLLDKCDGLVLSGGVDSNPKFYNGKEEYPNKPDSGWDTARDEFEQSLYRSALEKKIPVLAICRGLQLVNIFHGGDLIQDLGEGNERHKAIKEQDKENLIKIAPGTLLHEIVNVEEGKINSAHHQAINRVADLLVINCKATDGTIEGTEWKEKEGKPFLLCVQWHPERMFKANLGDSPLSKNIRNRFIEEIKKSIAGKNENH
jgi:putative glutamine amidotransferase